MMYLCMIRHSRLISAKLVDEIIPFNLSHNAEVEAIDLLIEVEQLDKIKDQVNKDSTPRVARYLIACADYQPDPEEQVGISWKWTSHVVMLCHRHGCHLYGIRVSGMYECMSSTARCMIMISMS